MGSAGGEEARAQQLGQERRIKFFWWMANLCAEDDEMCEEVRRRRRRQQSLLRSALFLYRFPAPCKQAEQQLDALNSFLAVVTAHALHSKEGRGESQEEEEERQFTIRRLQKLASYLPDPRKGRRREDEARQDYDSHALALLLRWFWSGWGKKGWKEMTTMMGEEEETSESRLLVETLDKLRKEEEEVEQEDER